MQCALVFQKMMTVNTGVLIFHLKLQFGSDIFETIEVEVSCTQVECEAHVAKAVASDEGNPEAWQTKARLSLVMEQFEVGRLLSPTIVYSLILSCMCVCKYE